MRPLADSDYDATKPLQTKKGAAQALRVSHNKIDQLIRDGVLKTAPDLGRVVKITTASILKIANTHK
jgi:hypothetical protein